MPDSNEQRKRSIDEKLAKAKREMEEKVKKLKERESKRLEALKKSKRRIVSQEKKAQRKELARFDHILGALMRKNAKPSNVQYYLGLASERDREFVQRFYEEWLKENNGNDRE